MTCLNYIGDVVTVPNDNPQLLKKTDEDLQLLRQAAETLGLPDSYIVQKNWNSPRYTYAWLIDQSL